MTDLQRRLGWAVVSVAVDRRPMTPWQRAYIGRLLRALGAPVWPR